MMSKERMENRTKLNGMRVDAVALEFWDIKAAAAFYAPLRCMEMTLRNAIDEAMRAGTRRSDWWNETALLKPGSQRLVTNALAALSEQGLVCPKPGQVVAQLSLGFWVSLVSRRYNQTLWVPFLHQAFPYLDTPRKGLHQRLEELRRLRNRISHQERIYQRDLAVDYERLTSVMRYLHPPSIEAMRSLDRVPEVIAEWLSFRRSGQFHTPRQRG